MKDDELRGIMIPRISRCGGSDMVRGLAGAGPAETTLTSEAPGLLRDSAG